MTKDREGQDQRIRERAYQLWDREGREHGRPDDHWHRARLEVEQEDERSGSPEDQHSAALEDPAAGATALPAAPEDEPAPATSATLEEPPTEPGSARPSPKVRASKPKAEKPAKPAPAPAPKAAAKPRKNPVG